MNNSNNSLITVRLATDADAGFIAELSQHTFYDTFAKYNSKENMDKFMNEQFSKKMLMNEVSNPENIFLIAALDNNAVGYAKMCESKNPVELGNARAIEIVRIYTEQMTIGKGVGKALMLKCIEVGKHKNKEVIWLGVWEHNATAISFYTKFGFEKFGTHIFMLGDDAQTDFLMKKPI
ncbi:MAG TPA: GNAT family N-acetyltransferase [Puia sp.]|nr:GNAT family N-acetyltransferase [Puia sp.]